MRGNLTARWAIVAERPDGAPARSTEATTPWGHLTERPDNEFLYVRGLGLYDETEPWTGEREDGDPVRTHHAMLELLDRWRREIADASTAAIVDVLHDLESVGEPDGLTGFRIRWTTPRGGANPGETGGVTRRPRGTD